ncbi:MAG TPA: hypothetical protein DEQ38_04745 [Elusimicrobia bacterium]|nr:MAG: hypothetical protein A2089_00710 [Elusimicrobia bacterium GWD2_63_28]HCC47409.1 hypothetical protein [Elusimicrobiota bacterium]
MKIENYRTSRYLNVADLGDGDFSLLFNGINGCLDEVPKELAALLASGDADRLNQLAPANLEFLNKRGHITRLTPEKELERFRELATAIHEKRCAAKQPGGLLLLLSYNCNLACPYCYQQKHRPHKSKAVMTPEMVDLLLDRHFSSILPDTNKQVLYFYGGEPFLPAHEPAIRRALEHAKKLGLHCEAISNTTMLESMIDIFGEGAGKVNQVQVSLDGYKEEHDQSRVAVSGVPTFDKIIANIKLLLSRGTGVSVRLNLDRKKLDTTPRLLEFLKTEGIAGHKKVRVYATPIHDNLCKVDDSDFMDIKALSEKVLNMGIDLEHPVSLRGNEFQYLFSLQKGTGLTRTTYCMQTTQTTLVADAFGDLYACFEEAGYDKWRVGHVGEAGVEFFPQREIYQKRHIANMPDCLACSVALACGGQCGVMCRAKTGDLLKPKCNDMKETLLAGLAHAYNKYKAAGKPAPAKAEEPLSGSAHD